ncbi:hypothetical protein AWB90_20105 [Mycobacterium paraense]|uniref:Uncharacterized protein n=1 Tax=Mycobacterium paraense TaxID=767916 RepID=A0A1X2A635_9MYCO|nr:hypothetical protein [Mycobacterium paraense]ORW41608.1 hypothetical protein AWB90_20105 [Mycobacterium paraense]
MPADDMQFQSPPRNMVQEVRNIIEGYRMGPLRALAQDPPQNSYDARAGGAGARVEYRLFERRIGRRRMNLLTVTDSRTTGLLGPALSLGDLADRAKQTGALELAPDEHWAAWEAMGYTKSGQDNLGSRGQGKAAFLYHSAHDSGLRGPGGQPLDWMVILYDSLLADGEYRLGLRFAQPADQVRYPPKSGQEAVDIVTGVFDGWPGQPIPLQLDPLTEPGTRVIVPFLSDEAADAFEDGELERWLERCWWRAIQTGGLEIVLTNKSGTTRTVNVPTWWATEPWRRTPLPKHTHVRENLEISPGLKIKRIVLTHDAQLAPDEIEDMPTQYEGVQLLRGGQWIETLGAAEKFGDFIPVDKRAGFRGFVEFDRQLERKLRKIETPQHDGFRRHTLIPRQIDAAIKDAVRAFAIEEGWTSDSESQVDDSTPEDLLKQISEMFLNTGDDPGPNPGPVWRCQLDVVYPQSGTTRVDWTESLSGLGAMCSHTPTDGRRDVTFQLDVIGPNGETTQIASRDRKTSNGSAAVDFDDLVIVNVAQTSHEVACPTAGKYRLRLTCSSEEKVVATATRNFYVRTDPPEPPDRAISLSVEVENPATNDARVKYGQPFFVTVTLTNRGEEPSDLKLDTSLEALLLDDALPVHLDGRLRGDDPVSTTITHTDVVVFDAPPQPRFPHGVMLQPGRYLVRADARDATGEVVAYAVAAVYVEVELEGDSSNLPFDIEGREAAVTPWPLWELEPPRGIGSKWKLWFARHHPTHAAAIEAETYRGSGLYGLKLFWAEVYCAGLVEYAVRLFQDHGDESGFRLVSAQRPGNDALWEKYRDAVERLLAPADDPVEYASRMRNVVDNMLYYVRQELA